MLANIAATLKSPEHAPAQRLACERVAHHHQQLVGMNSFDKLRLPAVWRYVDGDACDGNAMRLPGARILLAAR
jgi:hypothetical protein